MGLDFSWLGADDVVVVSLYDEAFSLVEPAISELQDRTGVYVDPYGATRITPDHARLLIKGIAASGATSSPDVRTLVEMLGECVRDDRWILATGD